MIQRDLVLGSPKPAKVETDWLGLKTAYFKENMEPITEHGMLLEKQRIVSAEGLMIYSSFGYSAFGSSWLQGISKLLPNQELVLTSEAQWALQTKDDPFFNKSTEFDEKDIPWTIRDRLNRRLAGTEEHIILPLSGGFDSRLLLWALRDLPRERIHCFTYGSSFPQRESREAVLASHLAKSEGVSWQLVPVGNHRYLEPEWIKRYGFHFHAHGMMHMQFYSRISDQFDPAKSVVLSGLVGDLFSGKITVDPIRRASELTLLGLTHGRNLKGGDLPKVRSNFEIRQNYFSERAVNLADPKYRIVELIRTKMNLLRYLIEVPESFGFRVLAPLVEQDIAMSMLNLPEERRKNRRWQTEFFEQEGLFPSRLQKSGLTNLSLDYQNLMLDQENRFEFKNLSHLFSAKTLEKASSIHPSIMETLFVLSRFGGSKKSALTHLYPLFSRSIHSLRIAEILAPLSWYSQSMGEKLEVHE